MNFHDVLVLDCLESSNMCLRYDYIYSREVSQESLFGLVKGQGGFLSPDFIASRKIVNLILKSLSSFGFIFNTILVIMTKGAHFCAFC